MSVLVKKEGFSPLLSAPLRQHDAKHYSDEILYLAYLPENLSAKVEKEGELIGLIPLLSQKVEIKNKTYQQSKRFGLSIPAPVFLHEMREVIFKLTDDLAQEHSIDLLSYYSRDSEQENVFKQFGYTTHVLSELFVDLTIESEAIFRNFTKGHRSCVKKNLSDVRFTLKMDLNVETFASKLQMLGQEVSAKEIDYYFKIYKSERLHFWEGWLENELLGITCILFDHESVHYHFSRNTEKGRAVFFHHKMIWHAINYYQKRGFQFFLLGVYSKTPHLLYSISKKKLDILHFKSGFSSSSRPFYIHEKFFNATFRNEVKKMRSENLKTEQFEV